MNVVTRELFDLPPEMASLPRDHRGFPVPKFVAWIDGQPDFRVIEGGWWAHCHNSKRCWLCGGGMGNRKWFVTGPMCTVTRTNSEPPCHRLCAEFAVKNCPFLTRPMAKRNDRDLPEEATGSASGIPRNPGVCAIVETDRYKVFRDPAGIPLIEMGPPKHISFWREGRKATPDEVWFSIETGLPALEQSAMAEGKQALEALYQMVLDYRQNVFARWA